MWRQGWPEKQIKYLCLWRAVVGNAPSFSCYFPVDLQKMGIKLNKTLGHRCTPSVSDIQGRAYLLSKDHLPHHHTIKRIPNNPTDFFWRLLNQDWRFLGTIFCFKGHRGKGGLQGIQLAGEEMKGGYYSPSPSRSKSDGNCFRH